jgi:citrate synthase
MNPWQTAIVDADATSIRVRGYDIAELMRRGPFAAHVFLLQRGRWPTPDESRLLDALLIASADHGAGAPSCAAARIAASGNRGALTAAIAAGVLAIGDEHGGAGELAMRLILRMCQARDSVGQTLEAAAAEIVAESKPNGRRLPGFGHRLHTVDPRVAVLFDMSRELGLAGDGIACIEALHAALLASASNPLPINIDGAVAATLHDLGFAPEAGKLVFVVARVAGIAAEVGEEHAREKPMRVKVPVSYDGPAPRTLLPDEKADRGTDQ